MSDTATLRTRIASELNRALSDSFGNSGETFGTAVNREINSAIKHYESTRFRWNEVRENEFATTVSGTRIYSLPALFVQMDTLKVKYNGSFVDIKKRTWSEIDGKDKDVSGSNGLPTIYCIYANVARLYPTPNGAYTLVASFIARDFPTSLTGSYTALLPIGGTSTITVTSTASHNNRTSGWYTDGEELIRFRAKAAVKINYLNDTQAINEATFLASGREPFLSLQEKQAYQKLADETYDMASSGLIKSWPI
jgi:hypothetical protein